MRKLSSRDLNPTGKARGPEAPYDLEEDRVLAEVRSLGAKRVLVQAPEGLKAQAAYLARTVEREAGCRVYVSGSPCFGACNLALLEAEALRADLLIHLGHTELVPSLSVKALYVEARSNVDIVPVTEKSLPLLEAYKRVGLITTIQHAHRLGDAKRLLEARGKGIQIGQGSGRVKYPGQVIGCDYTAAEENKSSVDAFLFIGGGLFHSLGAALKTGKPVVAADPFTGEAHSLKEAVRKAQRQRYAAIQTAKGARRFGVLLSIEPGQVNTSLAEGLATKLRSQGKEALLISVGIVDPDELETFTDVDAYVNTACPRLSLEDSQRFSKPILNVEETLVLLGEASWDEYVKEKPEMETP